MKRTTALFLSMILLGGCAGGRTRLKLGQNPEGEVIDAEGSCPATGDVLSGKKCALVEAQKAAVEKVIGVFISARTRVEKAMLIEQNILAKSDGYVKKYDILKEKQKDGFYRMTIRALVPPKDVEMELRGIVKSAAVGNPRVAVLLDEVVDGAVTERLTASLVITQALLDRGFRVVDREALAQANAMQQLKAIESGDTAAAVNLAQALQAEVLLVGQAQAMFNTDQGLGGMVSYRATVSVQALKAATGEIVSTVSKTISGLDMNRPMAADKARQNAAQAAANDFVGALAKALAKRAGIELTVNGVASLDQLKEIQKRASAVPGVKDFYTRSFENGQAVMDLDVSDVDATTIATGLERSDNPGLKVSEVFKDRLTAQVQTQP